MTRRWLVTGTDTGVGKTYWTARLVLAARTRGVAAAFKPVETGVAAGALPADAVALAIASGRLASDHQCVYALSLPAAPRMAAQAAAVTVDLTMALAPARACAADDVFVEGAGGWRVPITDEADTGAWARALEAPVLVVARAGLGTLNHSALTVEAIHRDGFQVAAVLLNRRVDDDPRFAAANADELRRMLGATSPRIEVVDAATDDVALMHRLVEERRR